MGCVCDCACMRALTRVQRTLSPSACCLRPRSWCRASPRAGPRCVLLRLLMPLTMFSMLLVVFALCHSLSCKRACRKFGTRAKLGVCVCGCVCGGGGTPPPLSPPPHVAVRGKRRHTGRTSRRMPPRLRAPWLPLANTSSKTPLSRRLLRPPLPPKCTCTFQSPMPAIAGATEGTLSALLSIKHSSRSNSGWGALSFHVK